MLFRSGPLVGGSVYEFATAPNIGFAGLVYVTSAALAFLGWIMVALTMRSKHAAL